MQVEQGLASVKNPLRQCRRIAKSLRLGGEVVSRLLGCFPDSTYSLLHCNNIIQSVVSYKLHSLGNLGKLDNIIYLEYTDLRLCLAIFQADAKT